MKPDISAASFLVHENLINAAREWPNALGPGGGLSFNDGPLFNPQLRVAVHQFFAPAGTKSPRATITPRNS